MPKSRKPDSRSVFKIGTVSLVFIIIAYQVALFVQRAATLRLEAHRDRPDTVYVTKYISQANPVASQDPAFEQSPKLGATNTQQTISDKAQLSQSSYNDTVRINSEHSPRVEALRAATRKVESFRFDPNTATLEDLIRLGFSRKQAESIDNYRLKGGRFRRKSDFARSYVVSDSVYRRLEKYIDIPLVDINKADSAAFDALPGIGPYYAAQMVQMREKLGGYSHKKQLMDIWKFDSTRFIAISDLICCSEAPAFELWTLDADQLRKHPYIANWQIAKAIVLYRDNNPKSEWSIDGLLSAGVLSAEAASKLSACNIASP